MVEPASLGIHGKFGTRPLLAVPRAPERAGTIPHGILVLLCIVLLLLLGSVSGHSCLLLCGLLQSVCQILRDAGRFYIGQSSTSFDIGS